MRPVCTALVLALFIGFSTPSFGLSSNEGRVVKGPYTASGRVSAPGLTIRYLPSKMTVNIFGRVRGRMLRRVVSRKGKILESGFVKISGTCRSLTLRPRKGTFTAPATVRLSDGAVFLGTFNGLSANNQRLSRFFRGRISGNSKSLLVLRAR